MKILVFTTMISKTLLTIALLSTFLLFAVHSSQAEDATPSAATPSASPDVFNFEVAYKDYVFTTDQYNKAHSDYLLSRAQYFQAQTLASKTKARDATAIMIRSRDDVMMTYLTSLRLKLAETEGVSDTTREGLFTRIDTDVSWWRNHKGRINSAGTLEDLTNDSNDAEKHYPTTEALAYEVLSTVPVGKGSVLRTDLNDLLSATKTKISQIRGNGDHDTTKAERWVLETQEKLVRSLDKENEAQKLIATLVIVDTRAQRTNKGDTYNQVLFRLDESLAFLKEANSFMKEMVKQLKTK